MSAMSNAEVFVKYSETNKTELVASSCCQEAWPDEPTEGKFEIHLTDQQLEDLQDKKCKLVLEHDTWYSN